jgi:hypothetical protein
VRRRTFIGRNVILACAASAMPFLFACDAVTGHRPVPVRRARINGPLRVSALNPRYFADTTGHVVYLTGSHTWTNFQDGGTQDPPPKFDYDEFLSYVVAEGGNFFRLWRWEQAKGSAETPLPYWFTPMPYVRTGPGNALDGKPRFDLTRFNEDYFSRMRLRVEKAQAEGIYTSIMLFNGWSIEEKHPGRANPWLGHPFNRMNNVNGIDGDPNRDNEGTETHTLAVPAITALQEAYVRKVIDTVGDLDNVLYEISNESPTASTEWEYHMIRYIKQYEAMRAKQHPVGMTAQFPNGNNAVLFASPADWVSANGAADNPMSDPPASAGRKVMLDDTDHLCGLCEGVDWAWKSFVRGRSPVYMDFYRGVYALTYPVDPDNRDYAALRRNLGYIRAYAERLDLTRVVPHPELASTRYCLAFPDAARGQYLAYIPGGLRPSRNGRSIAIDLRATPGWLSVEWFSPRFERVIAQDSIQGGVIRQMRAPFPVGDAVLYLRRAGGASASHSLLNPARNSMRNPWEKS